MDQLERDYLKEVPNRSARLCDLCENFVLFVVKETEDTKKKMIIENETTG